MIYILGLMLFVILITSIIESLRTREIFNPTLIFIAPISISFCVNCFYYHEVMNVSDKTYFIYGISVICFCFGLMIGKKLHVFPRECTYHSLEFAYNKIFVKLFWLLSLLGLIFAIRHIISGVTTLTYGNHYLDNLRHYSSYISEISGLGKYGSVFANIIMLLSLYNYFILGKRTKRNRLLLVVSVGIYFIYFATDLSRTTLLFAFATGLFIYITGNKVNGGYMNRKPKRTIVFVLFVMVFLFDYIARATNKATMANGEYWWIYYFGSQFYILDKFILPFDGKLYGIKSLGIFGRVLYKFGLMPEGGRAALQEVLNKAGSPVSSFVSGPYLDYGIVGSVLVMFIYGILIGYIYKRYRKSGGVWIIAYATCVYQCVLAFYAFCFGDSMQFYIFILLFIICSMKMQGFNNNLTKIDTVNYLNKLTNQ